VCWWWNHDVVRLGVHHLLGQRAEVSDRADLAAAQRHLKTHPRDLLLLDLSLGDDFGLAALPRLRAACPGIRVIVLTSLAEDLHSERALRAGADGFVPKSALASTLLEAMDTVMSGHVWASPDQRSTLLRRLAGDVVETRPDLSAREVEVLRLVGAGKSTREIAEMLNRSVKTIEPHKQALKTKLGADSPAQLLRQALHGFGPAT
jgi:DNA-binding NarL/FixJ family response regulator